MRLLTLGLLLLLALVQAELWFGKGGRRYVCTCRRSCRRSSWPRSRRGSATRLAAEVEDLKEGLEMVEEKARSELGMIKPDEILVQLAAPP